MPSFFTQTFRYEHPWQQVTSAIFQKYPNPFAAHVLTSDVIDRHIDPETGILHTTRLFLKKGTIPKWGKSIFKQTEAYILEQSTVDPRAQTMVTVTKNLSMTKVMLVEETQTITPSTFTIDVKSHSGQDNTVTRTVRGTDIVTKARIVSNMGWESIRSRIEHFGVTRFKYNSQRSSNGLRHVIERISSHFHDSTKHQ